LTVPCQEGVIFKRPVVLCCLYGCCGPGFELFYSK
jgi:hypothetical protein